MVVMELLNIDQAVQASVCLTSEAFTHVVTSWSNDLRNRNFTESCHTHPNQQMLHLNLKDD